MKTTRTVTKTTTTKKMTDTAPRRLNQFTTTVVLGVVVGAGILQLLPRDPGTAVPGSFPATAAGVVSEAPVVTATVDPIIVEVAPSVSNVLEAYGVAEVVATDDFRSALPDSVLQILADYDAVLRVPADGTVTEEGGR